MSEMDRSTALAHRRLGGQVVTVCGADLLIACGEYAGDVVAAARARGDAAAASDCLPRARGHPALPWPGDLAGRRGLGQRHGQALAMERVVEALHHYPRRRAA